MKFNGLLVICFIGLTLVGCQKGNMKQPPIISNKATNNRLYNYNAMPDKPLFEYPDKWTNGRQLMPDILPPDVCKCGVANPLKINGRLLIIEGGEAAENEFPWQVGLVLFSYAAPFNKPLCGGSLISEKTVLTAAHCLKEIENIGFKDFYVLLGEHNITDDKQTIVKICDKEIHPKYDQTTVEYDFVILTLCESVTFSKEISPICLPEKEGTGTEYENTIVTVSGWGMTHPSSQYKPPSVLMKIKMTTIENSICTKETGHDIKENKICARAELGPQYTGNFTCIDVLSLPENQYSGYQYSGYQYSGYLFEAYGKDASILRCNPCPSKDCNNNCVGKGDKFDPLKCKDAPAKYQSTCTCDSGGPVTFQKNTGEYVLVGLVSYGSTTKINGETLACGQDGKPKVFGRVSHVLNWINEKKLGGTCAPKNNDEDLR